LRTRKFMLAFQDQFVESTEDSFVTFPVIDYVVRAPQSKVAYFPQSDTGTGARFTKYAAAETPAARVDIVEEHSRAVLVSRKR